MLFAGTITAIASLGEVNRTCSCTGFSLGGAYVLMNERDAHAWILSYETHLTQARVLLHHRCSFLVL